MRGGGGDLAAGGGGFLVVEGTWRRRGGVEFVPVLCEVKEGRWWSKSPPVQ